MSDDPKFSGEDRPEPSIIIGKPPPPDDHRQSTPRLAALIAIVALAVMLIVVTEGAGVTPTTTTAPPLVAGPTEPPPVTEPNPPRPQDVWNEVSLPYTGVVSTVAHGPLGWMAVAPTASGIRVLTSSDGSRWDDTLLPTSATLSDGLGRGLGRGLAGSTTLVVTGGQADEESRVVSFVSDDAGSAWQSVEFPPDAAHVRNITEAQGDVYALGARQQSDGTERAAVWRLADSEWVAVELADPPGADGQMIGLVSLPNSTALIGSAHDLAVWKLSEAEWLRTTVSIPGGLSEVDPIDVMVDSRDRAVLLAMARVDGVLQGVVLRSDDLNEWELVGDPFPYLGVSLARWDNSIVVLGDARLMIVVGETGLSTTPAPIRGFVLDSDSDGAITVAVGLSSNGFDPRVWSSRG